ncbi:helix-turn-helix domain-containing protein [Solwaraspora sp. WMMD792]|uniref:helix-turn-helix domain-containing protein n=1 Tax=Solwaraspora sp. WMMD792 TaxID=3016099 RepID=UPI002417190A|nr:helix-turn-helix domain-containing protein [Solwaraspora sp. WMMD792]MDG4768863.1 helix-turn-helix domain-containing protein [Solwaraspora sp. WMMD792]MDG4769034.1 helix-turn-helix domain-containing protein [Solwaraspora sp. WMMD792]
MTNRLTEFGHHVELARGQMGLSGRKAAARAGISEGRWRQIVTGHGGKDLPPAKTAAAMLAAVDLDPATDLPRWYGADDVSRALRLLAADHPDTAADTSLRDRVARIRALDIDPQTRMELLDALLDAHEQLHGDQDGKPASRQ